MQGLHCTPAQHITLPHDCLSLPIGTLLELRRLSLGLPTEMAQLPCIFAPLDPDILVDIAGETVVFRVGIVAVMCALMRSLAHVFVWCDGCVHGFESFGGWWGIVTDVC